MTIFQDKVENLATKTWDDFVKFRNDQTPFPVRINGETVERKICEIVVPTMPILYFGNCKKYQKSKIKILTVGLNPSDNEFRDNRNNNNWSFFRFPGAKQINTHFCVKNYLASLNAYFEKNPYKKWFDDNRRWLFEELDASYYGDKENTCLHIDFATPIATNPTWSNLCGARHPFAKNNTFDELIDILSPDIILMSFNPNGLPVDLGTPKCYQEPGNKRNKKYYECVWNGNGKEIKVLNIVTANQSFAFRRDGQGHKIFKRILSAWKKQLKNAKVDD